MAQEEHTLSSSHCGSVGVSGGGGGVSSNRSRNVKQKKVPQRGLGVAQLERIRIEEQQKRGAVQGTNVLASSAIGSTTDTSISLTVQCPSFGQSLSPSPNSVTLPPSPTTYPSPNALFGSSSSVPFHTTKQLNEGGGEIDLQAISGLGNGIWPRLWSGGYNLQPKKQRVEDLGFANRPQVNLQHESNGPFLPLPAAPQKSYQFQQLSSSVVTAASGISGSPVLSYQIEPPSNQILHGSNYTSSWPEEDKMVGMKRPYPFSLEIPPSSSFPASFYPKYTASRSTSDELPSFSSGYTAQMEARHNYVRDGPSNSSPLPDRDPAEVIGDDVRLNGDILTLAPPEAASPSLNAHQKHRLDYSVHHGPEPLDFQCLPNQENLKSQVHELGPSGLTKQPFSFFPVKSQTDHVNNGNGEKGETIDLSLKL